MSQRISSGRGRQKNRLKSPWLWIIGVTLVVVLLIYFEQTAILYVLATVGMTVLLTIVAFADLKGADRGDDPSSPPDDAAAIGTGIGSVITPAQARSPRASRPGRRR